MWCVTVGARGSHRQPALHQPLAVDTLRVMLNDLMLRARVPSSCFLTFTMAFRAQGRNIRRERRRIWAQFPQHVVRAVTFFARRAIRVVLRHELPVRAELELLAYFGMARRAINLPGDRFARPDMRDAHFRVTLAA